MCMAQQKCCIHRQFALMTNSVGTACSDAPNATINRAENQLSQSTSCSAVPLDVQLASRSVKQGRPDCVQHYASHASGHCVMLRHSQQLIRGCRQMLHCIPQQANASRMQVLLGVTIPLCMCVHLVTQHVHHTNTDLDPDDEFSALSSDYLSDL